MRIAPELAGRLFRQTGCSRRADHFCERARFIVEISAPSLSALRARGKLRSGSRSLEVESGPVFYHPSSHPKKFQEAFDVKMLFLGVLARGFVSLSCSNCLASRRKPLIRYAYSALIAGSCNAFACSRSSSANLLHSVLGFGCMAQGKQMKPPSRCPLSRVLDLNLIRNELGEHDGTTTTALHQRAHRRRTSFAAHMMRQTGSQKVWRL
jgi:hypothetical protein